MPIIPPGSTGNCIFSVTPVDYEVISSGTTTNFDATYTASLVADLSRPLRAARTTSLALTRIVIDLGAVTSVQAFTFENTNFEGLIVQGGNDNSTWLFTETFECDQVDSDDGRRKVIGFPTETFNYRYIRLSPEAVPANGDQFYTFGAFGVWEEIASLEKNFSTPYEKTLDDDADVIEFAGGGSEVGLSSPVRIRFALQARAERLNAVALDQYKQIGQYPRNRVMLLYENQEDVTQMYHVRRAGSFRITRTENATVTVSGIQLLEVV